MVRFTLLRPKLHKQPKTMIIPNTETLIIFRIYIQNYIQNILIYCEWNSIYNEFIEIQSKCT